MQSVHIKHTAQLLCVAKKLSRLQRKWDRERTEENNWKVVPIKCQVLIILGDKIICFTFMAQTAGAGVL